MNEAQQFASAADQPTTSDELATYEERCHARVKANHAAIAQALAAAGVASVTALYEGTGDSGGLEDVSYWDRNDQFIDEKAIGKWHDDLMEFLYDLIEIRHGGYENNEGGGGEFRWDLTEDGLIHEHWDYLIERDCSTYEGLDV
jgi:hypothetical protein